MLKLPAPHSLDQGLRCVSVVVVVCEGERGDPSPVVLLSRAV